MVNFASSLMDHCLIQYSNAWILNSKNTYFLIQNVQPVQYSAETPRHFKFLIHITDSLLVDNKHRNLFFKHFFHKSSTKFLIHNSYGKGSFNECRISKHERDNDQMTNESFPYLWKDKQCSPWYHIKNKRRICNHDRNGFLIFFIFFLLLFSVYFGCI